MPRSVLVAGCSLHYTLEGSGTPVLLLQGVGVSGSGWKPQVEYLAARHACVAFDNRGMGLSQPSGAPITVGRMAEDALAILDDAGIENAHVVGHSLGGLVGIQLALAARGRVRSLSLLNTFSNGRDAAPLSWRMIRLGLGSRVGPRACRRRAFLRIILSDTELRGRDPDRLAEELAPLFGHDLADQPAVVSDQLRAMRGANLTPRLGELVGLPALVMGAPFDPIAPPAVTRALAMALNATYVEVPSASHGLPISHAALVNSQLAAHFGTADAAW